MFLRRRFCVFVSILLLSSHTLAYQLVVKPETAIDVIDTRSLFEQLITARPRISPSSSVSTPVAYGVGWGTVFAGVTGQTGTQYSERPFGHYALGFGLGDPYRYFSLTSILTTGGLDEVVRDGNLNFQLSRNFSPYSAIAIGIENVAPWGAEMRNYKSIYVVATTLFSFHPGIHPDYCLNIITSIGVGNSRFVHSYETHTNETKIFRPFANIGIQLLPQLALIADYAGLTYNLGISVVPFLSVPLVASLTASDLNHRGGWRIPIAGSIGYSYTF